MASCPKCGKAKMRRRRGIINCRRCGPSGRPLKDKKERYDDLYRGYESIVQTKQPV